jgi:3-(3-hydroxy-phenyl)propionate hydroxylase
VAGISAPAAGPQESRDRRRRADRPVAALELARRGVPCVLLEAELQVSEGSRAIVFTRRSMEILQQVGVADPSRPTACPGASATRSTAASACSAWRRRTTPDDRFFPMINLQQQYLEEYLLEAVRRHPLIEMRWGNRVTRLDRMTATPRRGGHARRAVHAGAPTGWWPSDGARSGIRARWTSSSRALPTKAAS